MTNPNDMKSLFESAELALNSDNFKEAEQKFLQYLKLKQNQFTPDEGEEFFIFMARTYIGMHQYSQARECINYGVTISPDNPELESLLKQVITHETMEKALDSLTVELFIPTDPDSIKEMEYRKTLQQHGLTKEEIDRKVADAIRKMKGWIDEKTALFVIAKEMGLELNTKLESPCNEKMEN